MKTPLWRWLSVVVGVVATTGWVVGSAPMAHAQGPHDVGLGLTVSGPETFYPNRVAFEASAAVFCTKEDLLPLTETEITFTAATADPWANLHTVAESAFLRVDPQVCLSGDAGPTRNASIILRWLLDEVPEAFVPVGVNVSAALHKHTADGSVTTYGPVNVSAEARPDYVPGVFLRPDRPQDVVRPGERFEVTLEILNAANGVSVVAFASTTGNARVEAGSPVEFTLQPREQVRHTVTLITGDAGVYAFMNFSVHGTSAKDASAGNASYETGYAVYVTHFADSSSLGASSAVFGAACALTIGTSRRRQTV